MPIECVWLGEPPDGPWQPGWCFPTRPGHRAWLSRRYLDQDAAIRPPLTVVLPTRGGGAVAFGMDDHPTSEPDDAWTVTIAGPLVEGQRPPITVQPSINCVGLYHGFLTDGVLTDDLG